MSDYTGIIYNDGVLDITQEDPNALNELTVHFRNNVEKTLTIPTYELPIATDSTLGGIIVGANLTIDPETGVLDATGGLGIANILFNTPTNSTNPVPVSASLSDYDYFTIVIGVNGANANQTSSAIVPAVTGAHYFLFQILESVGSGSSMMFPAGVIISENTSGTISFNVGVNRGVSVTSSGTTVAAISARTAYIKMIIGHKS